MSIDDLKADLSTNMAQAKMLGPMSTVGDIANHINNVLWPFVENAVNEIEDIDEITSDLYHGAEDILQPETGALFATVIAGGAGLVSELEKRLVQPADAKLLAAIREWKRLAAEAGTVLSEIVVVAAEGDDDEEDDDDDEDDDGNEDDEDTATAKHEEIT